MSIAGRGRCRSRNGEQYWAFEHINRRGVAVDVPFVRRAAALAAEDAVAIGRRLAELTGGAVTRVTQAKRIAAWLHDQLPDAAMREVLTVGVPADDDDDDDDDEAEPHEFSLTRDRVARVLAMLEAKRANGGLDAGGDQGPRGRNPAPLRRRGLAKKVRPPRRATSRWRAARPVSLRRRRADRAHDQLARARKFRI